MVHEIYTIDETEPTTHFFVLIFHVWTSCRMQEKNNINNKNKQMQSCIRLIADKST